MPRRLALLLLFLVPTSLTAQKSAPKTALPDPIKMPGDRALDSYSIYSSLIPLGETADKGWPHDLWLVEDTTTTVVPPDQPCSPKSSPDPRKVESGLNPHLAVDAPKEQQQDFAEILADFDAHCHERIALDADVWHLSSPVHLLNAQEQDEFRRSRFGRFPNDADANKYKGAAALYAFSAVYFNDHHSVALVYATHWCGGLCGEGFWQAFALKDGKWTNLHWGGMRWIS